MNTPSDSPDVLVAGGGAAGLFSAIAAAESGARVVVLEKNPRAGIKILMSGGSRCNITHHCDNRGIVSAYGSKGKFLHSPLASFTTHDTIDFFESEGVATKVEETGKVFPVSNRASDVLQAILLRAERAKVDFRYSEPVTQISIKAGIIETVSPKGFYKPKAFILTTGGLSFPRCGTTGDGYKFAASLGHTIQPTRPALVPVAISTPWVKELAGITVPDVKLTLSVRNNNDCLNVVGSTRGSVLFTHVGITGPCPLNLTRIEAPWEEPKSLYLEADFLPNFKSEEIAVLIQENSKAHGKKSIASLIAEWIPRRLVDALLAKDQLQGCKLAELSKANRSLAINLLKAAQLQVTGNLGYDKAEVTSGGIALEEVDFKSMRSRIHPNLFLAGEVLDLDGPIGGFNFQAAWSTGWLAGKNAAKTKNMVGENPI
jgi:predicted Rossmann fold flavoprotein